MLVVYYFISFLWSVKAFIGHSYVKTVEAIISSLPIALFFLVVFCSLVCKKMKAHLVLLGKGISVFWSPSEQMSKTQNWDFLFSFAYSLSNQNSGTTYGLFNIILFVLLGRGWSMLLVNMKNGEAVETSLPIAFPNMLFVNKTSSQWSQTIAPGWGFFFWLCILRCCWWHV